MNPGWLDVLLAELKGVRSVSIVATEFAATQMGWFMLDTVGHVPGQDGNSSTRSMLPRLDGENKERHSSVEMSEWTLGCSLRLARALLEADTRSVQLFAIINDFGLDDFGRRNLKATWGDYFPANLRRVVEECGWRVGLDRKACWLGADGLPRVELSVVFETTMRAWATHDLQRGICLAPLARRTRQGLVLDDPGHCVELSRERAPVCKTLMSSSFERLGRENDVIVNLFDIYWDCGYLQGTTLYHRITPNAVPIINLGFPDATNTPIRFPDSRPGEPSKKVFSVQASRERKGDFLSIEKRRV